MLVRNWPRMQECDARKRRPYIFKIPRKGSSFDEVPL
jgi:hypothetical protein